MIDREVLPILRSSGEATIAIAGAVTVYSHSFPMDMAEYFALHYKAASPGVIDLLIQLEEGPALPTTEGSSDTSFVIPESFPDIEAALAATTAHIQKISPITMPFARLKITGGATNDAGTTLTAYIGKQQL